MPTFRLHPLLIAGAACLTLAACGSDDDPPASQADAPAQATATTAPDTDTTTDESSSPDTGSTAGSDDGGSPTSETEKVRHALVSLQEAFAAKDGKKACSLMIGVPEKADPAKQGLSCELLSKGPKSTLSAENRKLAASAKVTFSGNEATAELRPGVPMKLRKVDGRWRVDYSQMGSATADPR